MHTAAAGQGHCPACWPIPTLLARPGPDELPIGPRGSIFPPSRSPYGERETSGYHPLPLLPHPQERCLRRRIHFLHIQPASAKPMSLCENSHFYFGPIGSKQGERPLGSASASRCGKACGSPAPALSPGSPSGGNRGDGRAAVSPSKGLKTLLQSLRDQSHTGFLFNAEEVKVERREGNRRRSRSSPGCSYQAPFPVLNSFPYAHMLRVPHASWFSTQRTQG